MPHFPDSEVGPSPPFFVRPAPISVSFLFLVLLSLTPLVARAVPIEFDLPAQPADSALLAFSLQAKVEVLFGFDQLHRVNSAAVKGHYEIDEALRLLLQDTGFSAQHNGKGKWVVTPRAPLSGTIKAQLLASNGSAVSGARVTIDKLRRVALSDENGLFEFDSVPVGTYDLTVVAAGYQPAQIAGAEVSADQRLNLGQQRLLGANEPGHLDPFVVEGKSDRDRLFGRSDEIVTPRTAIGNLDLPRTENDPFPYSIYTRNQISSSGVVNLNEYLQRELLDTVSGTLSPEQDASAKSLFAGSSNLNLRGYGSDATIVLLNGRRLPEVLSSFGNPAALPQPDVNFIPFSLVERVEVLPLSAAALYSGNPVGGVINIVLRPDEDTNSTEVTATYTNAVGAYNAPQSSVLLMHSHSLLRNKLHLRLSANQTQSTPPTEGELGHLRAMSTTAVPVDQPIYRATPNVRSLDHLPLFGPGSSSVTSVAPGTDGQGGIGAFAGRQGIRNLDFFDSPGGFATSQDSIDYPFGRRQKRTTYFASAVYDPFPWIQIGVDGILANTVINRGYDVFRADLSLKADSPLNPFKHDVVVSLNEIAPALGENYSEARTSFASAVLGVLIKLPDAWKVSLDAQYGRDLSKFRGLQGADPKRWQQLVDQGVYNPLRDTQVFGPPAQFYDQVLIYNGTRGQFRTVGDYSTLDGSVRATNASLNLPMGNATLNVGADYRRNHLAKSADEYRFSDGSFAVDPKTWTGRTLERYSFFGELQTPLMAQRWLPKWLRAVDADTAVRYIASSNTKEAYVAPTLGLKLELPAGFAFRGSVSTSTRFPTPQLHGSELVTSIVPGSTANLVTVADPRLPGQRYAVQALDAIDPNLRPEANLTQSAGLIFQRGLIHHFRFSIDFVDTQKTNELYYLDAQTVVNLENLFPERVNRVAPAPGSANGVTPIVSVLTGVTNIARRHSDNWNLSLDYAWRRCFGGTIQVYSRTVYVQRWDRQLFPNNAPVDELRRPDGLTDALLRLRSNFGASWFNQFFGFGFDGHYFHSRILPTQEWISQGSDRIEPFWQFDPFLQSELSRWLPWKSSRYGLRGQLRINNIFGTSFPHYANDSSGAGVQPYGDWRGRVYSLSLTATF